MNAHNKGFCDGILGRESNNEYGYGQYKCFEAYTAGFLHGMTLRRQYGIKIKIERTQNDT